MNKTAFVVDIFCGAGGLSYGFGKNDSFQIIAANDIDKAAINAYALNHPTAKTILKDICQLDKSDLKDLPKIDLLLGGPPCQSYSTLGKRKMDERANLFKQYLRILKLINPKIFIFENVTGILSMQNGELFKNICLEFENLGFCVSSKVLNALHFGVPQFRERVIIVGVQSSIKKRFTFPKNTHSTRNFVAIKNALDDLPIIENGENGNQKGYRFEPNNDFLKFVRTTDELTEHCAPNNAPHLVKIMQTLKDGEDKSALPESMRPKSGYCNTYAKLWWDRPAQTITRNFATPSSSRCIHPRDSRAMSIREGARLQSFPDDYKFYGNSSDKKLQIGNAVPPLLSIALAKSVKEFLEN